MTIAKMREAISYVYGGPVWQMRVREMPDRQVIAVYKDMEREGRLKSKRFGKKKEPGIKKAVQLSMFDKNYKIC